MTAVKSKTKRTNPIKRKRTKVSEKRTTVPAAPPLTLPAEVGLPELPAPLAESAKLPKMPLPMTEFGRRLLAYMLEHNSARPSGWLVEVTPQLALLLRNCGGRNRKLRTLAVERYSEQLRKGRWMVAHQGVALSKEDKLLDGQHRLEAIIRTGISAWMTITFDVNPAAMSVIDSGNRRTTGESLFIAHDMASEVATLASVLRSIDEPSTYAASIDTADARRYAKAYEKGVKWAIDSVPKRKMHGSARVRGTLVYCYAKDPEKAKEFAAQVVEGLNVPPNSPAARLRHYVENKSSGAGAERFLIVQATMICAHAFFTGQKMGRAIVTQAAYAAAKEYFEPANKARKLRVWRELDAEVQPVKP